MRILQLICTIGFYGAENVVLNLANEFRRLGHECVIGILFDPERPHQELYERVRASGLSTVLFESRGRLDLRPVKSIRSFMKAHRTDILHCHNFKSNFYGLLSRIASKVALVSTCHLWGDKEAKMRMYELLDKIMLRKFDHVVAVSEALQLEILDSGINGLRVSTILNGIDMEKFRPHNGTDDVRRELGIGEDAPVVGIVGRLTPQKGHMYLLTAAQKVLSRYPQTQFLVVGDGPLKESLKLKAGNSNFIFTGVRDDMPRVYSAMDIFTMPSIAEGLPIALLEAMAAGKPVVATRVGGIPNVIDDQKNGLLIEPANSEALAESLIILLENSDAAANIAAEGQRFVFNNFSASRMAAAYLDTYSHVLQGKDEEMSSCLRCDL